MTFGKSVKSNVLQTSRIIHNLSNDVFISNNIITTVNMKNCGRRNVSKHREIKGSDKYVTLEISLKFDSLYKMKITSSESKKIGKIRKGVDYLSGFQGQSKATQIQKGKVYHQKCQ